jgi:SAM-dependent methyltransferase
VERSAAETLPFEERSFDAATVSMAFHDLDDPTTVVHELRRVLRPGGDLLLLELTLPDDPRVRLLYGFLRSLRAIRDLLRLGAFGQVVDAILNTPGHSVVIDCLVSNGFAFDGYVQHGVGLTTSYLFRFAER